ncbi:MAG: Tad domain-containing protein [Actinomycetia bacterium]|nr:Tad domain-containing protein [Actinomycetes bacterium]
MRRMKVRISRLLPDRADKRGESGAVLVFVAISIVMLFGFTAFAIDFGRIYSERRELQNGADAAALAVAFDCASGDCGASNATAETYADGNASDGRAAVDALDIDLDEQRVHVRAITEDSGGDNNFDMIFAQIVGYDGLTVGADATVIWGPLKGGATLPATFSTCEWDNIFKDRQYTTEQVSAGLPVDALSQIIIHGKWEVDGSPTDCIDAESGARLPGGFAWLEPDGKCWTDVVVGDWVDGEPGNTLKNPCDKHDLGILGEIVLIPYYESVTGLDGNGNGGKYLVEAIGALYVTGYNISGASEWLDVPRVAKCTGSTRCIEGYFVSNYVASDGEIGGEDRGVTIVVFES